MRSTPVEWKLLANMIDPTYSSGVKERTDPKGQGYPTNTGLLLGSLSFIWDSANYLTLSQKLVVATSINLPIFECSLSWRISLVLLTTLKSVYTVTLFYIIKKIEF